MHLLLNRTAQQMRSPPSGGMHERRGAVTGRKESLQLPQDRWLFLQADLTLSPLWTARVVTSLTEKLLTCKHRVTDLEREKASDLRRSLLYRACVTRAGT